MRCWAESDEELRSIRIRSSIGHRQETFVGMWVPNLFIIESVSVYRLASCAITMGGVASLHHEPFNHSVHIVAFVM